MPTDPGKSADRKKQTIIALAGVGAVIVAFMTYRYMKANGGGGAQGPAPTATGQEGGGTNTDMQTLINGQDQIVSLITQLGNLKPAPPINPPAPAPTPTPQPAPSPSPSPTPHPRSPMPTDVFAGKWYRTKANDTLAGIANAFKLGSKGQSWRDIVGANRAKVGRDTANQKVGAGIDLYIPATAAEHNAALKAAQDQWRQDNSRMMTPLTSTIHKPTTPAVHGG